MRTKFVKTVPIVLKASVLEDSLRSASIFQKKKDATSKMTVLIFMRIITLFSRMK